MSEITLIRRNIHTYPFKYRRLEPAEFFAPPKAAIYIHIPFCTTKCHFCDYAVYTDTSAAAHDAYVDALCREISRFRDLDTFPGFQIDAVYFGGGTPGLLSAASLIHVLDVVRSNFRFTDAPEIAIEFDPACIEAGKLADLRAAGFTRLSIGVQSFSERILEENNRPHDLAQVYRAWEVVGRSGFTHTNIDLIYPLIHLDLDTWRDSLDQAIALGPACITAYPLEVWPHTAYHAWLTSRKQALPPRGIEVEMCRMAFDALENAGYTRGSTSGYYHPARALRYCRFLDYYWRTDPMIGFGISSKSVIPPKLYTNIRSRTDYIRRIEAGEYVMDFAANLTREEEMRRVMIRGLKMCEVSKPAFKERFGVDMERVFGDELAGLVASGLVVSEPDRIYLTREGQVFATNAWEVFYTENDLRPPREDEVQFGISELITN